MTDVSRTQPPRATEPDAAPRAPIARPVSRRVAHRRAREQATERQLGLFRTLVDRYAPGTSRYAVPSEAAMAQVRTARTDAGSAYEWRRRAAEADGHPAPPAHGAHLEALAEQDPEAFDVLRALRHQFVRTAEHLQQQVRDAPWLLDDSLRAARGYRAERGAARAALEAAAAAAVVGATIAVASSGPVSGAAAKAKVALTGAITDGPKAWGRESLKGPFRAAGAVLRPGAHAAAAIARLVERLDAALIHEDGILAGFWGTGRRMDLGIRRVMLDGVADLERALDVWCGTERPRFVNRTHPGSLPVLALDGASRWPAVDRLTRAPGGLAWYHGDAVFDRGENWPGYVRTLGIALYDPAAEESVLRRLDSLRVGTSEADVRPLLEHPTPEIRRRTRAGIRPR